MLLTRSKGRTVFRCYPRPNHTIGSTPEDWNKATVGFCLAQNFPKHYIKPLEGSELEFFSWRPVLMPSSFSAIIYRWLSAEREGKENGNYFWRVL